MNNGKKECTILWRIENYSYCWHQNREVLRSPEFTLHDLEGTTWYLGVFPKGSTSAVTDSISLYLYRAEKDAGSDLFRVKFELSIVAEDGSSLHSINFERSFRGPSANGSQKFMRRDDVHLRRKDDYLPKDTLSVRCKLWTGEGDVQSSTQISARTRIMIEYISYFHTVENFSALHPDVKQKIEIRSHLYNDRVISSSLHFMGDAEGEENIVIEIASSHPKLILRKCKVSLKSGYENIIECGGVDNAYDAEVLRAQTLSLSLSRQAILNKKTEYLPNDKLSLICQCDFSSGLKTETIEIFFPEMPSIGETQKGNHAHNKDAYKAEKKPVPYPSVIDDMKDIYVSQRFTDVELKTETKSFPAHKIILCARSPVFEAMMASDMREKTTARIRVDDLENDTVEQLLLFLYSDRLKNLQWKSATQLYYAADKYQIGKLKAICSRFLAEKLDALNASELLLLADTHNDYSLMKVVQAFILKHEEQVFGSYGWKELMVTNSLLTFKTMHMKYKRNNNL